MIFLFIEEGSIHNFTFFFQRNEVFYTNVFPWPHPPGLPGDPKLKPIYALLVAEGRFPSLSEHCPLCSEVCLTSPYFQLRTPLFRSLWVCPDHIKVIQEHRTTLAAQRLHRPCGGLENLPLWQNGLPHLPHTWTVFTAAGVHPGAQVIPSGPLLPAGVQARSEALLPGVCPVTGSLYPTQGGPLVNPLLHPGPPKSNSTPSSPRSFLSSCGKRDFATWKRPLRGYGTDIAQFQKCQLCSRNMWQLQAIVGLGAFPMAQW